MKGGLQHLELSNACHIGSHKVEIARLSSGNVKWHKFSRIGLLLSFPSFLLALLSPFCGITKEMMSRGHEVADMEYRETT